MTVRVFATLVLLALAAGCSSGLRDQRQLADLYEDDGGEALSHRATVPHETFVSRTVGRIPQMFGVEPSYHDRKVEDPGTFARERMRELLAQFPGRPGLLAQSLPVISRIAMAAPFDLSRAHAVRVIGEVLKDCPRVESDADGVPASEETNEETSEEANEQTTESADGETAAGGADDPQDAIEDVVKRLVLDRVSENPAERLSMDDRRRLILRVGRETPDSLKRLGEAIRAVGLYCVDLADEPRPVREAAERVVYRLARTIARVTLTRTIDGRSPHVRARAASALAHAGEPWAESLLIGRISRERDPMARRKVYRAIDRYRTPRVASTLLRIVADANATQADRAGAKRALSEFTGEDFGYDGSAWSERLVQIGALTDDQARAATKPKSKG